MAELAPRLAVLVVLSLASPRPSPAEPPPEAESVELRLAELERLVPREAAAFSPQTSVELARAADALEQCAAQVATLPDAAQSEAVLDSTRRLLVAKRRVDQLLDEAFEVRRQFAALAAGPGGRDALGAYLRTVSQLIDLSGRLRYLQVDALDRAASRLPAREVEREELLDLLVAERSSVGALVMSRRLLDPAPAPGSGQASPAMMLKLFDLIAATGQASLLPHLVRFLQSDRASPELAIAAAEAIRRLGLPQDPRPDPPAGGPVPPITAGQLHDRLSRIEASRLEGELAARHAELVRWLESRSQEGLSEATYRLGTFDVRPGDWLLMRNPSPYNQFTDLAPGLFTHVGVVALEQGADGIRRMVLVDLPERGTRIPATNVEAYLDRTLHYVFLRHPDPGVARDMGAAARSIIGNPSRFDLTFRTERVGALAAKDLAGEKIDTYCAGLLLLCALQTSAGREEFFPINEFPAGGRTVANLGQLGLAIGDELISPTGALFSPRLEIVGRREPMYDPRRQVEEAIFDHFAACLIRKTLAPSPDLFQSLRLKLAEASRDNPLLARALAKAARVDADIDLVSAAKAAAVVETLDEIAFGASGEFLDAWDSLRAGPLERLAQQGYGPEELALARRYRRRHAGLYERLSRGQVSPRELRIELVNYYIASGKRELQRRFFRD